jgi:hypothetical protein
MATTPVSTPMPEAQPQAKISAVGRVFGVLFSPKTTFEDIARKPSWILPVIITTILSLLAVAVLNQRMNWRAYISEQIEKNPSAAQLSPEEKDRRIELSAKITSYVTWVAGALAPIIFAVVVGGILMGAYNLLAGTGARFSQAFAIVAHAGLVGLVQVPIFILVVFLKPPGTLDPNNVVATNVAAFLPDGAPKWLDAAGKNIDIFVLWITMLIAFGFAAVNPRKLKGAKPFTIAFGLLALWIVIRMGIAFVFS